ncbi:MAG: integrin alpha [Chloroflexota bacterium]
MRPQRICLVIPFLLFLGLVLGPGRSTLYGAEVAHSAPPGKVSLPAGVSADWWAAVQRDIAQSPSPRGLSITPDWTAESDQAAAYYGGSVATAGDVNGDGYDDVIVGAFQYDSPQLDEGRAYLYFGSAGGLSQSANWISESNQSNAAFGISVSSAGDVNGDGYDDAIVGADDYGNGGRVFVVHGSATGLSLTPDWTAVGDQAYAFFGSSVAAAGDVNGDGYDDVIIGAPWYNHGQDNEGRAYVFHGSASGLSTSANWLAESNQPLAQFGSSVATAGDVNGDGYDDIIVGAYYYDNGQDNEGRAFVYHGSAAGLSLSANWTAESDQNHAYFGRSATTAGDVNNDGYGDVVVGADAYDISVADEGRVYVYYGSTVGLPTSPNWIAEGDQANASFGWSVATAGDVNGDGYDDVIIGSHVYNNDLDNEGRVFVYYGSVAGLSVSPDWTAESDQADALFGRSATTAGDVNGDGYDDVIVGADQYDNGQDNEGRAFVYHGLLDFFRRSSVPPIPPPRP